MNTLDAMQNAHELKKIERIIQRACEESPKWNLIDQIELMKAYLEFAMKLDDLLAKNDGRKEQIDKLLNLMREDKT